MAKLLRAFLLLAIGLVVQFAQAETFFDPTRPLVAGLVPETGPLSSAAEAPLVLQSVLLSPQRKLAVISGQNVTLGQSIRAYRLVTLSNRQAELQGPQGRLTLWLLSDLHPDVAVTKSPLQQGERK